MSELSLIIDRNRARSMRKKRAEVPKIDPNRDPTTLDLVFAEAAAATADQSDAPQKPKRSLKGVSQKMATMSRVDMNKKEVKPSQLNTGQSFQAPTFKMVIMRPKMDLNRALRVMGYTSSKEFLDTSKDPTKNPKEELQKKHFVQSMALFQKKAKAQEEKTAALRNKKQISADDEVRLLHEAYQFLVRKYHLQSESEIKPKGEEEKMETGDDDAFYDDA